MDIILLVIYISLLIFNLTLLLISIKRPEKKQWSLLYFSEFTSILLSLLLTIYYNYLPGYGIMPGLTYFSEFFYSLCAVATFSILLLISFIFTRIKKK